MHQTDDLRIAAIHPLIPPAILMEEIPISDRAAVLVDRARSEATRIIHGQDDRLLVIVGPCSIHDVQAALEYGRMLGDAIETHKHELHICMRVYFEKPRTTVGWKGLINDPLLDGSYAINKGLRLARKLLLDLAEMGVPAATEFVDTITPQFLADLVAWAAIGARTTESPVHRQLASGLSMPVGFKNGTDGNVQIASDAIRAVRDKHHFLSVTKQGISAIVATRGNDAAHAILRGSRHGPNYSEKDVAEAMQTLGKNGLDRGLMVDCSHGNSSKDYRRQPEVCLDVARQVEKGSKAIMGVMLESHLVAGRQDIVPGQPLVYGQSITDACIDWASTTPLFDAMAKAVIARRKSG
jgi:3-deoxy-7-phosphoheptulonate synthase